MAIMSQKIDVHQHITDRIIAAIEQGAGAFKLPWNRPAGSIARPTNIESGKGYRGINIVPEARLRHDVSLWPSRWPTNWLGWPGH